MGPSVGCAGPSANRSTSTPLKRSSYSPPRAPWARAIASGDTATRWSSRAAMRRMRPAHDAVPGALARGVEGAHLGRIGEEGGRHARTRARAARGGGRPRTPRRGGRGSCAAGRTGPGPAEPPSRWPPSARCGRAGSRRRPGAGRRRGEHPHLVAERTQRAGQPQHLALDATGDGQGVRTDDPDAHRRRLAAGPADADAPEAARSRTVTIRSDGQLGWRRCHCSGARRIRSSRAWARSWVTRWTSSRSRPCRVVSRAGSTMLRRRSGPSK